ncbi:MAG: hypothetical protein ABJM43_01765 [Paracoccaceae bacterium]
MNWFDLTQNWAASFDRLIIAFPKLERSAMPFLKQDQMRFEQYLAATHEMTLKEARDALDSFMKQEFETQT